MRSSLFCSVILSTVAVFGGKPETWSDQTLPVREGLSIWLDSSRQRDAHRNHGPRPLFDGNLMPAFYDASGNGRDLVQSSRDAMPRILSNGSVSWVRFDGVDDFLTSYRPGLQLTNLTVFIVGAPRTNAGLFRCFLSMAKTGVNDYLSGLNMDLGPGPGVSFGSLNIEGAGAGGVSNLLDDRSQFGTYRLLGLLSDGEKGGIQLFADGKAQSSRERTPSTVHADHMVLGARFYSNDADPQHVSGFFGGDIAEVLIYERVLADAERTEVEEYLRKKYKSLLAGDNAVPTGFNPLAPVLEPPAVQMFLPGFASRELPVKLPNINCIKYRPDGKLVALGYNGHIYLLSDSDGDGIEDKVALFWETNSLRAPIGMALTPVGYAHGQGVFVAAKGKLSLIVDTNGDERADQERVIAEGWQELSHGVDALGVAMDKNGAIYFGLGVADFTNPYLIDRGRDQSRFDPNSERGTILKVSPDFKIREIVARGIRFPVALAFNSEGDLFCTDQEGATWLPNGNPLDELLHVQSGRYYGFPPRHPKYLPHVIDEPSTFDYGPQHQSLCGLNFNPPGKTQNSFGPERWAGDAFIAGYSRGKLYRTKLVKIGVGYVADTQLIAALNMLTVDVCVTPAGHLLVATHSGQPDWGSGPTGAGKLYEIRHSNPELPQPVLVWPASATETQVAFDRPLTPEQARRLVHETAIAGGKYIVAGERFESLRPGYQVVQDQLAMERTLLPILSTQLSADRKNLMIQTPRRNLAINYALTLNGLNSAASPHSLTQHQKIDLSYPLHGLEVRWGSTNEERRIWLPHFDARVSQELTKQSVEHRAFWDALSSARSISFRTQLDLWQMLRPAVQPGSKIDYELPPENVTVTFESANPFILKMEENTIDGKRGFAGRFLASVEKAVTQNQWLPIEVDFSDGRAFETLAVSWHTSEDKRPRPLPLHRMLMPWAVRESKEIPDGGSSLPPEIINANWLHGRRGFFSEQAACSACHRIRGEGHLVGPDLSNLIHRDFHSVLKDIVTPNATINPDHVNYQVELNDGEIVSGVLQREAPDAVTLVQAGGNVVSIPRNQIRAMTASGLSLMPEGIHSALGPEATRDLMKFLLTPSLEPAKLKSDAPVVRSAEEIDLVRKVSGTPTISKKALRILLVAGPKDHGPDEHDYPLWQERWAKLLSLADNVSVSTAFGWPTREVLKETDVAVFYSNNPGWSAEKASELRDFQKRGGGLVYIHFAVDGHGAVKELSDRIGLAWRTGASKFRHGPLSLSVDSSHPITAGFQKIDLFDESYWDLEGNATSIAVLASAQEAGRSQPLLWTREDGGARVFVSIPGHYTWTFDDPVFRLILLRAICWTAHEPVDRLSALATVGARMNSTPTQTK